VAVLPASVAAARPGDLHAIAIIAPALRGRIALAWPAGGPANPAARELINRARSG
jgi:hypothetical protein